MPAMSSSHRLARTILNGFHAMFADFQNITLGAKARFEQEDWHGVQQAQADRLEIYKSKVDQLMPMLNSMVNNALDDLELWREIKRHYKILIAYQHNYEIAETFFNSTFCKVFDHQQITNDYAFVTSSRQRSSVNHDDLLYNSYSANPDFRQVIRTILEDYSFAVPYQNLRQDVRNVAREVYREIAPNYRESLDHTTVDVMDSVFYRNKGAYLVGRICAPNSDPIPFVLPILHAGDGTLYVDTLIHDPDEVSIIFSFTRAYFMVDAPTPAAIVAFLHSLMPHKKIYELYASFGFRKHSKTEFYRDFVNHLQHSDDKFVVAPGIKGMVMTVFTLPSYDIVFKLIKDRFTPPKEVTADIVREKYRLVTRHDRVGRMADTQEFCGFRFPRDRFDPTLLRDLQQEAGSLLQVGDNEVIIKHLYTERRMTPLNLYLRSANEKEIANAMDEYGNAIKQLAAANIFPGDMLLKNFGVTRHGRVVFYDYDEICHITECNFRKIPEARTDEEEMASQPWYDVGPFDIFPEEFRLFFSGNPKARKAFDSRHSDLYDAEYWQGLKQQIESGKVVDVFPYRRKRRFDQN
jgi:isocitrate dehydrogenase kinase/phosphatase